jgi:hypothetical protein
MKMKMQPTRVCSQAVLRGKIIAISVYIKKKNRLLKHPNDAPQVSRKTRTNQTQNQQRREIIKIRVRSMRSRQKKKTYMKNQ